MYGSRAYRLAPARLQELMLDARWACLSAIRRSGPYAAWLDEARRTQWLPADDLRALARARLARLLETARRGSPYYRELLEAHGVRSADDLARLPVLDRDEVRRHADRIANARFRGWRFAGSTSGTSGSPLRLLKTLEELRHEAAFYQRQLEWAGHRGGDRLVWLRGDLTVDPARRSGPFWRRSRLGRTLYMSSYHLSASTAEGYLAALLAFRPDLIQAYPSSILFLANHLEATGREWPHPLKGIVTSSETLPDEARAVIERRFGARVHDWYGSYERVAAIGTCERGTRHLLTDYSLVELRPAAGGLHQVIGTNLANLAFPLLRYDTGDQVVVEPGGACGCGRRLPTVARIVGRQDDVVKTPSGRRIGRLDHVFKGARNVLEARIVQRELPALTIEVVPAAGFSAPDERRLLEKARTLTGGELSVELVRVDHIERGPRGKHRLVDCRV